MCGVGAFGNDANNSKITNGSKDFIVPFRFDFDVSRMMVEKSRIRTIAESEVRTRDSIGSLLWLQFRALPPDSIYRCRIISKRKFNSQNDKYPTLEIEFTTRILHLISPFRIVLGSFLASRSWT